MGRLLAAAVLTGALLGGGPVLAAAVEAPDRAAVVASAGSAEAAEGTAEDSGAPEPTDAERVEELFEGTETTLEAAVRIAAELDESPLHVDEAAADRYPQATLDVFEEKVAATEHPDGLDELFRAGRLEQEARGAGGEGLEEEVVAVEGREDEDRRPGARRHERAGRLDPVHVRHLDVHADHVRIQCGSELDGGPAVRRLADHLDLVLRAEDRAEAETDERLVVHEQHADHEGTPGVVVDVLSVSAVTCSVRAGA